MSDSAGTPLPDTWTAAIRARSARRRAVQSKRKWFGYPPSTLLAGLYMLSLLLFWPLQRFAGESYWLLAFVTYLP